MIGVFDHSTLTTASSALQKQQKALPHLTEPHDSLRLGVHTLKDRASTNHPVEAIEEQASRIAYVVLHAYLSGCRQAAMQNLGKVLVRPDDVMCMQFPEKQEAFKMQMLKNLYGSALPARIQLDKQILSK